MVTGTYRVALILEQRKCPKSALTALACDYLTAVVILATAHAVMTAV